MQAPSVPRVPPLADGGWQWLGRTCFLPHSRQPAVQELAATVQEPPSRYLVPEQDRLNDQLAGAEMSEPVPTIDLRRLLASDGADEEAAKLRSALQSWGFFPVTNHGIETSLMDALVADSREFFRKPLEEKQQYSNLIEGKQWQREGYGNDPVKTQDQILDWCDWLHLRVEPEDERNLDRWPGHLESFRGLLHEYTLRCKRIKDEISSGRWPGSWSSMTTASSTSSVTRAPRTPGSTTNLPVRGQTSSSASGRTPTSASSRCSSSWNSTSPGCRVLRDGTWYSVPAVHDRASLVNVGVSLEIMSNGIFRGPVHRVVTNSEKERMSLAMFYAADLEEEIEPIAVLLDKKQPARYQKIKCRDFLAVHYYFSKRERVIESLKI